MLLALRQISLYSTKNINKGNGKGNGSLVKSKLFDIDERKLNEAVDYQSLRHMARFSASHEKAKQQTTKLSTTPKQVSKKRD